MQTIKGYHVQTLDYATYYISNADNPDSYRSSDSGPGTSTDLIRVDAKGPHLDIIGPDTIGLPCPPYTRVDGFTSRTDAERVATALLMVTGWTRTD